VTRHPKTIALRYYEAWNTRNLSIPDEIFAPSFAITDEGSPIPVVNGPDGVKQRIVEYCAAFPDLAIEVEGMIAEGDTVITTWTLRGTHRGEFLGVAASGNKVEVTGTTLHRIEDGVIAEARVNWDTLSLMRQIGALP
jgi:steroid delta-isomerase-like uncharacterized protein